MKPQLHFLVSLIDLYGSRSLIQITPTATAWDEAIAEILEMHRGIAPCRTGRNPAHRDTR